MNNSAKVGSNPFDIFVIGARKGFNIAINNLMPNVLMAYVIAEMLNLLGVMQIIGHVCAPLMGLFGLPGEAAAVLIGGWMSMGGGIGVAIGLFDKGIITGEHLAILAPAIYLMGSQVQYLGRILGVIGTRAKRIPLMIAISVVNAFLAMLLMRIIL